MLKLKLESLQVQSFDTTAAPPQARGTVQAHAKTEHWQCVQSADSQCACTMDLQVCGDTHYIDCTYGCTYPCQVTDGTECYTQDPNACPYTEYLDCSMGCTDFKSCVGDC
jgi:hypothetical protein